MMQIDTLVDEMMKILYVLSFMHRGMVQVWATNETNGVLSGTPSIRNLDALLTNIENAFTQTKKEQPIHSYMHSK